MTLNVFNNGMLRSFKEDIFYNIFKRDDIPELKQVIKFAEGLIIKNGLIAEMYETESTLFNANSYIAAVDSANDNGDVMSEIKRRGIVRGFEERNPYYVMLKNKGVDPYSARKAKDMYILLAKNKSLSPKEEDLFYKCYYEMLNYYSKVTLTNAFDNQTFIRQYYINYILFGTILKYISYKMENYFDVDQYGKKELKNGFISWGMDYFDNIPLPYQRRIYKSLNDLIRNKGTNRALKIINDLFSFQRININKYVLAKVQDTTETNPNQYDVALYKVPFNERFDPNEHDRVNYDEIIDGDPYWRSSKEDILKVNFNAIDTKYISTDVAINLSSSSKELSYFMNLLNQVETIDKKHLAPYMKNNSLRKAREDHSLLGSDFYFMNYDVSNSPIYLYDAIVALQALVFKYMNYNDRVHRINFIKGVFSYNYDNDITENVKTIRNHLFWYKKVIPKHKFKKYMSFFSTFKLRNINNYQDKDAKDILNKYESNIIYRNQLLFVGQHIEEELKTKRIKEYAETGNAYDALETLALTLLDPNRMYHMDNIFNYPQLQSVLADFVDLLIETKTINNEKLFTIIARSDKILEELSDLSYRYGDSELITLVGMFIRNTHRDHEDAKRVVDKLLEIMYKDSDFTSNILLSFKNLFVYLTVFTHTKNLGSKKDKMSLRDLIDVFNYNENLRKTLEKFMSNETDPILYNEMEEIWNKSFVGDFDMTPIKPNSTLDEYLIANDPNLHKFSEVNIPEYDFQTSKLPFYREKVFELASSIDGYLALNEDLFTANNFVGMSNYIRRYVLTLVEIFKAFTLQTLETDMTFTFKSEVDNGIKITDMIYKYTSDFYVTDDARVFDVFKLDTERKEGGENDGINITDTIKITPI